METHLKFEWVEATQNKTYFGVRETTAAVSYTSCSYLRREEEFSIQGRNLGQAVEVSLRSKREGDVVSSPVHTGMHIAGRVHGVTVGHFGSAFPVRSQNMPVVNATWDTTHVISRRGEDALNTTLSLLALAAMFRTPVLYQIMIRKLINRKEMLGDLAIGHHELYHGVGKCILRYCTYVRTYSLRSSLSLSLC